MNKAITILQIVTKNKIDLLSVQIRRIISSLSILIWLISIILISYNLIVTTSKTLTYYEDLKIINEIEAEFNKNPYQLDENTVSRYHDADSYYMKFTKLSFYNGDGFVPELVKINLDIAKKQLGVNPILIFLYHDFLLIILFNIFYLLLLKFILWLKFGN
ncbi:hypothetical protein [Flavobacterium sp.]|uniref:hypothetical protein n=1 Tax=Flavobacterium sp. TaxID=239 RepID=UPI00260DD7BE|nr:hypothetical protein [Flavobacterium sp.]